MPRPDTDRQPGVDTITRQSRKVVPPRLYKVLLHNDDYTPMDFVVFVLVAVFHRSDPDAAQIMLSVHRKGIGLAGVYPFAAAETKVAKVTQLARADGHPLKCTMEPE